MPGYLIATCHPSKTLDLAQRMREEAGSAEAVIAPCYRATVRRGPQRKRVTVEKPVIAGAIFVEAGAVAAARAGGSICSCRSEASARGGAVLMFDTLPDDEGTKKHALVDGLELEPLVDYARQRDEAFEGRGAARMDAADDAPLPTLAVGQHVALLGVLSGMVGVVASVRGGDAVVELDAEQAPVAGSRHGPSSTRGGGVLAGRSITVPVAMVAAVVEGEGR